MRRGTPRRSEQNQSLDEEIGKIPEQLQKFSIKTKEYSHIFKMFARDLVNTTFGKIRKPTPGAKRIFH
jgi:hypothetical protein